MREAGGAAGARIAAWLAEWVHGTGELPLEALLGRAGVAWQAQPPTLAQRWGMRVAESALTGVKVTHVLRGGAAERAGLAAGDELVAAAGWRLRRLDDVAAAVEDGAEAPLVVARDQRMLALVVPAGADGPGAVKLSARPAPAAGADGAAAAEGAAGGGAAGAAALALRRAWLRA